MTPDVHSKRVRLASAAFNLALAGKWAAATRQVKRISDECGGEGLHAALIAWCDTLIDHALDGGEPTGTPNLSFVRTDTGQLDEMGSSEVPAEVQWAGRLIRTRAAMDHDGWQELIDELPEDGYGIGGYVGAVLRCTALTVNGLPRGFARMGRAS